MENKKHNIVAAWILTGFELLGGFFAIILFDLCRDILTNAAALLFGGFAIIALYVFLAVITVGLAIYPIIRSSKLLFGYKEFNRVGVWFIFVLSIGTAILAIALTLVIFLG